jgi:hypothetical protein
MIPRNSFSDPLCRQPPEHFVRFYEEDSAVPDKVARRAAIALRNGGSSVIVATAQHRAEIAARMIGFGLDIDAVRSHGRVYSARRRRYSRAVHGERLA